MDEHTIQNGQQSLRMTQPVVRTSTSAGAASQRRFDGLSVPQDVDEDDSDLTRTESWVELASQPSSSSLSSIGDEIVTTGLQVGSQYGRRRRLLASARSLPQQRTAIHTDHTSSQEEYEETESEDDNLMISSNERSSPEIVDTPQQDSCDSSDSDGDDATALGRAPDRPAFRPQPNAFSHPQRSNSTSTAIPTHPHNGFTRPSFSQRSQTRVSRGPNFMSPSAREDNDAALRASLTTLLSCAAAARGIPKTKEEMEQQRAANTGVSPSNQPMDLRFVPESQLDDDQAGPSRPGVTSPQKRATDTRPSSRAGAAKTKRSVSTGRNPRTTKKKKSSTAEDTLISPTMLTWVVSAGVVVLVSVVGFGAGYVIGREVGRQEALSAGVSTANETTSCGREVIRSSSGGLRRLKWSDVGRSIVASS